MENRVKSSVCLITIILLVVATILSLLLYKGVKKELDQVSQISNEQQYEVKTLVFLRSFIKDVLKADEEVSFETRLKLETAVRNLDDEVILAQWQKFVESKTEQDAQDNVRDLLDLLVDKVLAN